MLIGGPRAYKKLTQRGIFVSYEWVNGEPAMILFPAHPGPRAGAYVICLSSAYKYAGSDGYPSPDSAALYLGIAEQLGGFISKQYLSDIKDVVLDSLPDLVKMPAEPDWDADRLRRGDVLGETKLIIDGTTVSEGVL